MRRITISIFCVRFSEGSRFGAEAHETPPEAQRVYKAEEKVRQVAETFTPGEAVKGVSWRHGGCAKLPHRWRRAARGEAAR